MNKLALLVSVCAVVMAADVARAQQQVDIAVGGGTVFSPKPTSASEGFVPPTEKGGTYPSASAQAIFSNHFGFNVEGAFRYDKGLYNGFQRFRPALYDANLAYAARVTNRIRADAQVGIGGETVFFYNQFGSCNPIYGGSCAIQNNSTHFTEHIGGDLRYYFWRNVFVRPEAHYYHIQNNTSVFSSNNVIRFSASIGISLVRK